MVWLELAVEKANSPAKLCTEQSKSLEWSWSAIRWDARKWIKWGFEFWLISSVNIWKWDEIWVRSLARPLWLSVWGQQWVWGHPQFVRRTDWCLLFTDGGVVVYSREICCGEGPSSVISQLEGEVWCMGETSHHHLVMEVLSLPDSPASTLRPPADCCSDIINTSHDTGQLHHVAAIST